MIGYTKSRGVVMGKNFRNIIAGFGKLIQSSENRSARELELELPVIFLEPRLRRDLKSLRNTVDRKDRH